MSRKHGIAAECYAPVGREYVNVKDLPLEQRKQLGTAITHRIGDAVQEYVNRHPESFDALMRIGEPENE